MKGEGGNVKEVWGNDYVLLNQHTVLGLFIQRFNKNERKGY